MLEIVDGVFRVYWRRPSEAGIRAFRSFELDLLMVGNAAGYGAHAASLAPITILSDALALGSATAPSRGGRSSFEYGWVRGAGSAAFISGTLVSGQAVGALGLDVIVGLQAALLAAAACAALTVPELRYTRAPGAARIERGGVMVLLRMSRILTD